MKCYSSPPMTRPVDLGAGPGPAVGAALGAPFFTTGPVLPPGFVAVEAGSPVALAGGSADAIGGAVTGGAAVSGAVALGVALSTAGADTTGGG